MPTYDYKCEFDESEFEKNVPVERRDDIHHCPMCGRDSVYRVISFNGLVYAPTAGGMR